jgi:hypothetical protein
VADNISTEGAVSHSGRKLYLVPLVLMAVSSDAPAGYNEKVEAFWREAAEHVRKLEGRFGPVRRLYHESVAAAEAGAALKSLERANAPAFALIDRKLKLGAQWTPIEEAGLLQEVVDWSRCLTVASGPAVVRQLAGFLREASQKRNTMMAQLIDASLGDNEAGLLIIRQDHAVQFPPDIQVFYVAPPTLDEIARLLRDAAAKEEKAQE